MPKKKAPRKNATKKKANTPKKAPLLPGLGGSPWDEPQKPPMGQFEMERMNQAITKVLEQQEFEDPAELSAFLNKHMTGRRFDEILEPLEQSPEEEAQDLAYEAMEATSLSKAQSLYRKALNLDPHCIDALKIKAELNARSPKDLATRLQKIVADAEERLGKDFFKEHCGHFWAMVETRPYMRARLGLAMALEDSQQIDEAIVVCEEIIRLNPTDNQGARDMLRQYYLTQGDTAALRQLNKKYPESFLAAGVWSEVLERWLSEKTKVAEKRARAAHKLNPYVAPYLCGAKKTPKDRPEFFSPGDDSEAIVVAANLGKAWRQYPEAMEWLKSIKLK